MRRPGSILAVSALLVGAACARPIASTDQCAAWSRAAVDRLVELITAGAAVTVFLEDDIERDAIATLEAELRAVDGVADVTFESRAEAHRRFSVLFALHPELVRASERSSFPRSIRVRGAPDIATTIRERFDGRAGVVTVRDERETVTRIASGEASYDEVLTAWERAGSFEGADGEAVVRPAECS